LMGPRALYRRRVHFVTTDVELGRLDFGYGPCLGSRLARTKAGGSHMIAVKAEDFGTFLPNATPQQLAILATAPQALADAGLLVTPLRLCHVLAQVMTESAQLKHLTELLDYRAHTLATGGWKSHFPTEEFAKQYEHNPEKLANYIYGETSIAQKLGNTQPGDG